MILENKLNITDLAELAREEEIIEKYVKMNIAHPFREEKVEVREFGLI